MLLRIGAIAVTLVLSSLTSAQAPVTLDCAADHQAFHRGRLYVACGSRLIVLELAGPTRVLDEPQEAPIAGFHEAGGRLWVELEGGSAHRIATENSAGEFQPRSECRPSESENSAGEFQPRSGSDRDGSGDSAVISGDVDGGSGRPRSESGRPRSESGSGLGAVPSVPVANMDVGERRVRTARVVSVHDDEVIIDVGRDQGLEVGMHIDLTPPSDDDVEWEEEAVIGEVDAVEEHRARVRIRWREVASVGTPVAVTPADTTGSLVAPPGPPRSIRLRAGVIAGTPINDLGINLLVNGELELRRGRFFLARVVLRPTGMSIGQGPDFGGGGAYAQLGFDHHLIGAAVGLGVERVWDDGCCGSGATGQWEPRLTYPTSFRVGAVDGLMAEVTTLLMIEQRELRLLAVHAELQFPMRRNAWLAFRGSGGGAALFWHSEALVKLALRGNGDSGTTRLELGIGAVGTTDENPSRSLRVGPSLVIGVHHQL